MGICSEERNTQRKTTNNMDAAAPILSLPLPERDFDQNNYSIINITVKPKITINSPAPETKGNNIIKMKINIEKNDVNKPTKILYNLKSVVEGCDLNELNESNTELYINNKKYKYKSYFIPEKEGIYNIQLNINVLMKNCSCLFYGLTNLQSVDLSSFNTSNCTNMSYMFYCCENLENLDLSSFNTENVTDMCYMFHNCKNLKRINLSSFNTKNLTCMYAMFYNCTSLQSLDLSSFNTINVTNMSYMFYGCIHLQNLDLSSFNTKNIKPECYIYMYGKCDKIERVILSYEAKNIEYVDKTFYA